MTLQQRRDRQIFASSTKAMERLVRAERQRFMDVFVDRVADRLSPETAGLMQSSLADTDSITAFHAIKGDPGSGLFIIAGKNVANQHDV